jgi:MinD superfamily P-loop ATPase
VRKSEKQAAAEQGHQYVISDGPPGIACPVISSLSGANLALLVTEPTLSGMHDLERVIGVCRHFDAPVIVCINKYDINEENAEEIERYCATKCVPVVGKIRFDSAVTEALVRGSPVVEYSDGLASREIRKLWDAVRFALE